MGKVNKIAVFDGNWFLHRAFHSVAHRLLSFDSNAQWHPRVVNTVVSMVASTALRLKAKNILVCFDGPDNFRKQIYPLYKSSRGKAGAVDVDAVSPNEALDLLRTSLRQVGFRTCTLRKYEADDLLASAARVLGISGNLVYLVTSDKDMVQLVNSYVYVYTPSVMKRPEVFITPESVQSIKRGMTASQHHAYQILAGDATDDIPSVLSPAKAHRVVTAPEFTTLGAWFKTETGSKLFNTRRTELVTNKQLVTLVDSLFGEPPEVTVNRVDNFTSKVPKSVTDYHQFVFAANRSLF